MESRHISVIIAADPDDVYAFAADPANLPRWASGLAQSDVEVRGDELVVASPMGEVVVRFAPRNAYGILDHAVTLPSGETVDNPLRVVAHPGGAEVVFTVRRRAMTDDEFARDCGAVAEDLARLRGILEAERSPRD
ncbi:SRPBCC family protein [Microbacterium karelineae]|uniref:SRPBCC family protein n=1 Tax=Microbacterium karelineae TaxID=2654283 RepID=UPI0012E9F7D2|nr:SRPBCC family protein [Microbacterium karelineae]